MDPVGWYLLDGLPSEFPLRVVHLCNTLTSRFHHFSLLLIHMADVVPLTDLRLFVHTFTRSTPKQTIACTSFSSFYHLPLATFTSELMKIWP